MYLKRFTHHVHGVELGKGHVHVLQPINFSKKLFFENDEC